MNEGGKMTIVKAPSDQVAQGLVSNVRVETITVETNASTTVAKVLRYEIQQRGLHF